MALQSTVDEAGKLISDLLGTYTMCEGIAEDIGYAYLRQVPDGIVLALLGERDKRPWTSDQIAELLSAVIEHENVVFGPDWLTEYAPEWRGKVPKHAVHRKGQPRQGQYHLVAEWKWATRVRNDLAHSLPTSADGDRKPDHLQLRTRSKRHELTEITQPFTPADLRRMTDRITLFFLVLLPIYNRVRASTEPTP